MWRLVREGMLYRDRHEVGGRGDVSRATVTLVGTARCDGSIGGEPECVLQGTLSDKTIRAETHQRHWHAFDGRVPAAHELSDQKDGRDGGGRGSGASVIIVPPQHGQRSKAIPAFS